MAPVLPGIRILRTVSFYRDPSSNQDWMPSTRQETPEIADLNDAKQCGTLIAGAQGWQAHQCRIRGSSGGRAMQTRVKKRLKGRPLLARRWPVGKMFNDCR
jgi:hypothetical protein